MKALSMTPGCWILTATSLRLPPALGPLGKDIQDDQLHQRSIGKTWKNMENIKEAKEPKNNPF